MKTRHLLGALGALALVAAGALAAPRLFPAGAPDPGPAFKKLFVIGVLDSVHVVDLETGKTIKDIPTGLLPHNLVLSGDRRKLYVTNVGSQSVSVIDTQSLTKVGEMLVGEMPAIPQHAKADPAKLESATSCFECHKVRGVGTLPNALAWAPGEKALLVNEIRERSVTWLDPATGRTLRRHHFDLPTPSAPSNMITDPRTGEIWVLHRFEAAEYKKDESHGADGMAAFDHDPPAGQKVAWVTVHDPEMTRELARIKMELAIPFGAEFSPDGRWLYVAYRSSDKIAVFDTRSKTLARTFAVGAAPTGLALSADGKELYVTCHFTLPAVVQVVDTESGEVKVSMGIPPSPSLVKLDPHTGYVYVTATGYNAVLEIDPQTMAIRREFAAGHQPLDLALTP